MKRLGFSPLTGDERGACGLLDSRDVWVLLHGRHDGMDGRYRQLLARKALHTQQRAKRDQTQLQ